VIGTAPAHLQMQATGREDCPFTLVVWQAFDRSAEQKRSIALWLGIALFDKVEQCPLRWRKAHDLAARR
jgi:hypothetical protein